MVKKPASGITIDTTDPDYSDLREIAGRIAKLLAAAVDRDNADLQALLDRFLGVVYALILAKYGEYEHRTGPTEVDKVAARARDVERGWVRTDGRWIAGFHFYSGQLRLAAVYHQSLKVAVGRPDQRKDDRVDDLAKELEKTFPGWSHESACAVHKSVNGFKHVPSHDSKERSIDFETASKACFEIVDVLERWVQASAAPTP